jgi:hypothetical protein
MKYILKQIDDISGNNAVTTIEFSADTLTTVLEHVELFIRGCGFFPPEGNLDYVNDFEDYQLDQDWDDCYVDPVEHNEYYFDTDRNK